MSYGLCPMSYVLCPMSYVLCHGQLSDGCAPSLRQGLYNTKRDMLPVLMSISTCCAVPASNRTVGPGEVLPLMAWLIHGIPDSQGSFALGRFGRHCKGLVISAWVRSSSILFIYRLPPLPPTSPGLDELTIGPRGLQPWMLAMLESGIWQATVLATLESCSLVSQKVSVVSCANLGRTGSLQASNPVALLVRKLA